MKLHLLVPTISAAILSTSMQIPSFGQSSIEPGQPVVGNLHVIEANLEAQLRHDYKAGLIDPLELANMQRDLDAIKVKEEAFRMRSKGLTDDAADKISTRLADFQNRLIEKVGDKGRVATATYVEVR